MPLPVPDVSTSDQLEPALFIQLPRPHCLSAFLEDPANSCGDHSAFVLSTAVKVIAKHCPRPNKGHQSQRGVGTKFYKSDKSLWVLQRACLCLHRTFTTYHLKMKSLCGLYFIGITFNLRTVLCFNIINVVPLTSWCHLTLTLRRGQCVHQPVHCLILKARCVPAIAL